MNIIFGQDQLASLDSKYTVLELDTLRIPGNDEPITAYCVVESLPVAELAQSPQYRDLHKNFIKNYRRQNWNFCQDALSHLMGKWNKELDSFYIEMASRIEKFQTEGVPEGWDGIIDRTTRTDL